MPCDKKYKYLSAGGNKVIITSLAGLFSEMNYYYNLCTQFFTMTLDGFLKSLIVPITSLMHPMTQEYVLIVMTMI